MRLTKFGHSCLLVEEGGARVLLDPGSFSEGFETLEGLTAVCLTHQHVDHLDPERVRLLLDRNPGSGWSATRGAPRRSARRAPTSRSSTTATSWPSAGWRCGWPGATTPPSIPRSRWSPTSATWSEGGCSTPGTP
jgi:hypothetical protein